MPSASHGLSKAPTGIQGLDDITDGGLPRARSTLLCGESGAGKTLLACEFLVRGASLFNEPGVFFTFEESAEDLCANVLSFGFDVDGLIANHQLAIDHVSFEHGQISGGFDLDGLFIRLDLALKKVAAKRVVLDSMDVLFLALPNPVVVRQEMRRLVYWLKARGVTTIITAERGDKYLTRDGMEEYVSDCVIWLENRVNSYATTRLLRVVKYRGSAHGLNEYPFLITETGIKVLPVTTLGLDIPCSEEYVSSGVARLDTMLGGKGYYRDSVILVSGSPGSGKSSLAAEFARATCARGERCMFFLMEESRQQLVRNMRSIGVDLQPWVDQGLLRFVVTRPTLYGLEMHLSKIDQTILDFDPSAVVFDPISSLHVIDDPVAVKMMLVRLVNFLKLRQITGHFVILSNEAQHLSASEVSISSLIDTWVQLRDIESDGERNRLMVVVKSRGMAHSNQMREFVLSERGIELLDVYTGQNGVLTGTARIVQQAREEAAVLKQQEEIELHRLALERNRLFKEAQILSLKEEMEVSEAGLKRLVMQAKHREMRALKMHQQMAASRRSDLPVHGTIVAGQGAINPSMDAIPQTFMGTAAGTAAGAVAGTDSGTDAEMDANTDGNAS